MDLTLILLETRCADGFMLLCFPVGRSRFLTIRACRSIALGGYRRAPERLIFLMLRATIFPPLPKEKI